MRFVSSSSLGATARPTLCILGVTFRVARRKRSKGRTDGARTGRSRRRRSANSTQRCTACQLLKMVGPVQEDAYFERVREQDNMLV